MHLNLYFAWAAWITLLIIVLSRPLADLFKVKILSFLTSNRKYLGWLCGLTVILHIFIYALNFNLPLTFFFDLSYWDFSRAIGWGLLAFATMIPLVLTSNLYSIKLLKRNWKRLQRLTYLFFIASGIHIYLKGGKWLYTLVPMGIWLILWIWSYFRKRNSKVVH